MRALLGTSGYSPIGLELDSWEIRAVQLRGGPAEHEVVHAATLPRLNQPSESAALGVDEPGWLAGMLARRGFRGSRVATTAPSEACSSQILKLPDRASGAPIETIARAEIARARKSDAAFAVAAWYLPERGREEQGIAVACEQPALDSRLDALGDAGLDTVAVDLEEAAILRAWQRHAPDPDRDATINAIVHIGWDSSFGVLVLGGSVVYTRRIGFGVSDMVKRLSDRAGLDPHEAGRVLSVSAGSAREVPAIEAWSVQSWSRLARTLAGEIDTSVTYVSHAYRRAGIGSVTLAGYGSSRPELIQTIDERLGMPVEPLVPDAGCGASGISDPDGFGRLAIAYGLARRFDP